MAFTKQKNEGGQEINPNTGKNPRISYAIIIVIMVIWGLFSLVLVFTSVWPLGVIFLLAEAFAAYRAIARSKASPK